MIKTEKPNRLSPVNLPHFMRGYIAFIVAALLFFNYGLLIDYNKNMNLMNSDIKINYSEDGNNSSDYSYLSGDGVVIAVADTGIDLDHACFRNSTLETGSPGIEHRKLVYLNDTIDDWDNRGHQQYRHGTHIAGILACDPVGGDLDMRAMSYNSRLIFQDIVNSSGWVPPDDVTELLAEASKHGAIINSWSWGDNSIEYTNRSKLIDEYTSENPWSLVFVAAGNNGRTVLEPANSYNVVSVSASNSEENGSVWPSSSKGPDVNGRRGIFVSSPGVNVVSAKADGDKFSMNNDSYSNTGTSMATPMAASFTALLQEMVVEDFGFYPSAVMLKAMLAYSGEGLHADYPDFIQGYGRPDLSNFNNNFKIHDSYKVDDWVSVLSKRGYELDDLKNNPWNGSEASGPFLSTNDSWTNSYKPIKGQDLKVVMSYNARSNDYAIDDMRLIVRTDDGRYAIDDDFGNREYSQMYYESWNSPLSMNSSNETTVMIKLPYEELEGCEWVTVEVVAKNIFNGTNKGMLGLEGDKLGFGIVISGVDDLTENSAPKINIVNEPHKGENISQDFSILVNVTDEEGDGFEIGFRGFNDNFSIEFDRCFAIGNKTSQINCNISIDNDFTPFIINREDWYLEITVRDDNSSFWTTSKSNNYTTANFTIWIDNELFGADTIQKDVIDNVDNDGEFSLISVGLFGLIFGIIIGACVMFSRLIRPSTNDVLPPFFTEDE